MGYEYMGGLGATDWAALVAARLGVSPMISIGMTPQASTALSDICPPGQYFMSARCQGCGGQCVPIRGTSPVSVRPAQQPPTVIPSLPASPPPPSIVYSTPQVQQTAPQGHGPLFWLGLGAVGLGLFLVLRGRS
jgi:hypothetical protein